MTTSKSDYNNVDCIRFRLESDEEMEFTSNTSMRTVDEFLLEDGEVESFCLSKEASTPLKRARSVGHSPIDRSPKRLKIRHEEFVEFGSRSGWRSRRPDWRRSDRRRSDRRRSSRRRSDRESDVQRIFSFKHLPLPFRVMHKVLSMDVKEMNPLQRRIMPTLMTEKRDNFLIQSKSHSGKKLAYLITAILRIDVTIPSTQVIILAPTSELAMHIAERARMLTRRTPIVISCLTRDSELDRRYDQHLLVVTIGTLLILLHKRELFEKSRVRLLVHDEVDILHSGEESGQKMAKIAEILGAQCQQLFFSTACCRSSEEFITSKMAPNMIKLCSVSQAEFMNNVLQFYVDCTRSAYRGRGKYASLLQVLKSTLSDKVLVFVSGKEHAEELCCSLRRDGYPALCLSSKTSTDERLSVFRHFKKSKNPRKVLVINYPICHGLNFGENLHMVINYDIPQQLKHMEYEYGHRISKCGRTERPGFVVNMIGDTREASSLKMLENIFDLRMIRLEPFH